MALNHVALTVADRERSAAFYGEHFAMDERVHDDEHLLILASADGSLLALSEGEVAAGGLPRTNHFGFRLNCPDEVRAARERFRAAAVSEAEWQEAGPTRSAGPRPGWLPGRAVRVLILGLGNPRLGNK